MALVMQPLCSLVATEKLAQEVRVEEVALVQVPPLSAFQLDPAKWTRRRIEKRRDAQVTHQVEHLAAVLPSHQDVDSVMVLGIQRVKGSVAWVLHFLQLLLVHAAAGVP